MIMSSIRRKLAAERGQAIIMFMGLATVIAIIATITIDFGLWFSERRGAQKDSDLVALAGAYELLDDTSTFGDVDGATQDSALANDLDPADDLHNLEVKSLAFPDAFETDSGYCHEAPDTGGRLNAVVLDVDHDSTALFATVFGLAAPDIGAHACARAGSLRSAEGLRPLTVSMFNSECFTWIDDGDGVKEADDDQFVPLFGDDCLFRLESPSSQVGSVSLGDDEGDPCSEHGGGADAFRENIVEGSDAVCQIGDSVTTESGLNVGPTLFALAELLAGEGDCDALNGDGDGIDQFDESFAPTSAVPGPDVTFTARGGCTTPRAIHIIIVDEFSGVGSDTRPILGFAAFFLQQCEPLDHDGNIIIPEIRPKCDFTGSGGSSFQIRGFFMNILELEGDVGDFDEFGTNVIRLVE